ncbi:MAG: hypothetical protein JO281_00030 [Pseudonocardiales bacterium]|nr:hypothetical protein [Pseudonocardiales bacterium]
MYGQPGPSVVIAGGGVAAAALACLLRNDGFGVVLLTRRRRSRVAQAPVIEALPEATVRLLAEVGLDGALVAAGAVAVRGFDNTYGPGGARTLDGVWTHVDRLQLARECLLVARRRGAAVLPVSTIGPLVDLPGSGIRVRVGERDLRAVAAVDATGRAARWSRPVARSGSEGATMFTGPGCTRARPGRVVRVRDGWAYRLEHPHASTVGVVRRPGAGVTALDDVLAGGLDVDDPERFVRVGIRPAAVQWSCRPVGPGRIAVGDAALALSPLAGQGLRFAVSSALAAAAVLRTWNGGVWNGGAWSDGAGALALDYYRCFVEGVRLRHLATLAAIAGAQASGSAAPDDLHGNLLDPGRRLRWAARVERVGVNRGGRIVAGECCVLPDGGLVRWVGGVDLLCLRDAVADGRTPAQMCAALARLGIADASAHVLIAWALRVGALG